MVNFVAFSYQHEHKKNNINILSHHIVHRYV